MVLAGPVSKVEGNLIYGSNITLWRPNLVGWFATETSPQWRFARKDLAWDYPGVKAQGECLSLLFVTQPKLQG